MGVEVSTRQVGQSGETLIESLIAIVIISLVAVISYSGLQTALRSSDQHKESAVAETLLRSAAERLQDPKFAYIPRAGCPPLPPGGSIQEYDGRPGEPGGFFPTAPAGYTITATVSFWNPPPKIDPLIENPPLRSTDLDGPCPATDHGLQKIRLIVKTPSDYDQQVDIVKRAN